MKARLKVAARHVLGWTLILLSIPGFLLPILQGWLFLLAGLALIAPETPWARRLCDRIHAFVRRRTGKTPVSESERPFPADSDGRVDRTDRD